jgi:lipoate-protein ligase B
MALGLRLPGLTPYAEAHALQRAWLEARHQGRVPDAIFLLEHEETITLGRARGAEASVLAAEGVPVVLVERGGDATWHGPGQLVAYPVIALEGPRQDLHRHLRALEDAVIDLLVARGLRAGRDPRNTGVWLPAAEGLPRKVCSIGIACRRWITWHGLALNLAPDPAGFARIRPCGFDAEVMTRVVDHLPEAGPLEAWVGPLHRALCERLEIEDQGVETRSVAELVATWGLQTGA